jgi:hypothetical protein
MKTIVISCMFCEQEKTVPFTPEGFGEGASAYIAHLIESHWDKLELGREMRLASGQPINDAWTRI